MNLLHMVYIFAADTSMKLEIGTGKNQVNVPKNDANEVIGGVLTSVYYLLGIAAVIAIIVGGIMYATSAGDPNQITRAKNIILYSVVGIVVVLMAFTITSFVIGRIG